MAALASANSGPGIGIGRAPCADMNSHQLRPERSWVQPRCEDRVALMRKRRFPHPFPKRRARSTRGLDNSPGRCRSQEIAGRESMVAGRPVMICSGVYSLIFTRSRRVDDIHGAIRLVAVQAWRRRALRPRALSSMVASRKSKWRMLRPKTHHLGHVFPPFVLQKRRADEFALDVSGDLAGLQHADQHDRIRADPGRGTCATPNERAAESATKGPDRLSRTARSLHA